MKRSQDISTSTSTKMHPLRLMQIILIAMKLRRDILTGFRDRNSLGNITVGRDLSEHLHRIEPGLHTLKTHLVVDLGDGDTLDINCTAVSLGYNLLSFAVTLLVPIDES